MMTSFAFILGVVPLVLAEGAGAEMRRTLGTAVFSGMLGVTLFGIFLTPVFYYVIQWATERLRRGVRRGRGEPPSVAHKLPACGPRRSHDKKLAACGYENAVGRAECPPHRVFPRRIATCRRPISPPARGVSCRPGPPAPS